MENVSVESNDTVQMYAVFRGRHRVSNSEYESAKFAESELRYWQNILRRYPDGTHVEIRPIKMYTR